MKDINLNLIGGLKINLSQGSTPIYDELYSGAGCIQVTRSSQVRAGHKKKIRDRVVVAVTLEMTGRPMPG
jgi:hypothetical protein